MLTGYRMFVYLALPWVLLRLALRSLRSPDYRRRIGERFGFRVPSPKPGGIWIHAVSVGEVNAAIPLVRRIRDRWPDREITVTTMTPTGSDRVFAMLGSQVCHCYLPYDFPGAVSRFLGRIQPAMGMVMETEIWPNLIHRCDRSGIPLIYTNVRLSERSWRGYQRFRSLVSQTLRKIDGFAVQSDPDAKRLVDLGAPPRLVEVTGSLKFDMAMPQSTVEAGEAIRRRLGWNRPILLGASTHEGEEEVLLQVFRQLQESLGELLLVLVPRHPERFAPVERLCRRGGFNVRMASAEKDALSEMVEVLVVDSMGELPKYIAACDVVFMAGSLVPIGGHNLLEAGALGKPVVFGPHMFNFAEISAMFLAQGAGLQVNDLQELRDVARRLLEDAGMRDEYGVHGRKLVEQNRGALDKVERLLARHLNGAATSGNAGNIMPS